MGKIKADDRKQLEGLLTALVDSAQSTLRLLGEGDDEQALFGLGMVEDWGEQLVELNKNLDLYEGTKDVLLLIDRKIAGSYRVVAETNREARRLALFNYFAEGNRLGGEEVGFIVDGVRSHFDDE